MPSSSACGPGGAVRKTDLILATGLATSLAMAGCGGDRNQGTMTADLERDLQMAVTAQRPNTMVVSAIEGGPPNGPSGEERGRRDMVAVKRQAPRPTPQAQVQETAALPQLDMSSAPSVEVTEKVEAAPAPIPEPSIEAPSADAGTMAGGPSAGSVIEGTSRRGSGWGTAIGVIIRGASAGVDNCGPHDRRGGRNVPNTTGGIGVMGPMGPAMGGAIGGMIGGMIANQGGGGNRRAMPRR